MSGTEGRVLGIDYGTKRLGLALSDPLRILAGGWGCLDNTRDVVERLVEIIRQEKITLVVVGMPFAPDGGPGAMGEEVRAFVDRLQTALPVPVTTWDESRSSVSAQQLMRESGMRRRTRQEKGRVDEMAARLILQEYLDQLPPSTSRS
jgi:putative Holliday junction resolvase